MKKAKISCDVKGVYEERLYRTWRNMLYRCSSENHPMHRYYENISVCKNWKSYEAFLGWAMMTGYADDSQIDRIDNEGDYTPDNCRWVTAKENLRNTSRAITVTLDGVEMPLADACDLHNVEYNIVYARYITNGWTIERAISDPVISQAYRIGRKLSTAEIKRVVQLRSTKMTQPKIAEKIGCTLSIVSNILRGKTASDITGIKKRTRK